MILTFMPTLLERHSQRLAKFDAIDVGHIQEYVGEGRNHLVFKYKDLWVLKIPKVIGAFNYSDLATLTKDLHLIKKYFPQLMITTKLISNSNQSDYLIIQKYCKDGDEIVGEIDSGVREQLQQIIYQNKKLYTHTKCSLDLFGSSGFITCLCALVVPGIKPKLSNILLSQSRKRLKLFLVDTELLRLSSASKCWLSLHFHIRSWISYKLTSFFLRTTFKFAYA